MSMVENVALMFIASEPLNHMSIAKKSAIYAGRFGIPMIFAALAITFLAKPDWFKKVTKLDVNPVTVGHVCSATIGAVSMQAIYAVASIFKKDRQSPLERSEVELVETKSGKRKVTFSGEMSTRIEQLEDSKPVSEPAEKMASLSENEAVIITSGLNL